MVKRIGFLGPAGTYTEEATLQYDSQAELLPFPSIAAIGQAVSSGRFLSRGLSALAVLVPVMIAKALQRDSP